MIRIKDAPFPQNENPKNKSSGLGEKLTLVAKILQKFGMQDFKATGSTTVDLRTKLTKSSVISGQVLPDR